MALPSLHCLPSLAQIALFTENIFQVGASKRPEEPIIDMFSFICLKKKKECGVAMLLHV